MVAVRGTTLLLVITSVIGDRPSFDDWAAKHGKSYASEEYEHRYGIWKTNRNFVNTHNAEAASGVHTFRVALNQFGDMTNEEYRAVMLGRVVRESKTALEVTSAPEASATPPPSVDWRLAGIVPDVKNQANCGSCWAFSAVVAMEAAYNQKANGTVPSLCTTKCGPIGMPCCSFSEQELVDCVNGGKDTCKQGGDMFTGVTEIVKQMKGIIDTEAQYPYTSGSGESPGVCHSKTDGVVSGLTGYTPVKSGDETDLLAKSSQTVVSVAIDASQTSFQFYSDGVYDESACKNDANDLDHGVAVVGYGVKKVLPIPATCSAALEKDCGSAKAGAGSAVCRGCCNAKDQELKGAGCTEDNWNAWCSASTPAAAAMDAGTPYWLVRNSWGKAWGMEGYILMSRNKKNQCGVATSAIIANVASATEVLV